jgi:putative ABC transport system permease protein
MRGWQVVMFKSCLNSALRHIIKNKVYSCINIAGLAIGMACCILIMLWVSDELSFDRFHENAENICQVAQESSYVTPSALAAALKAEYPEIVDATRYEHWRKWQIGYGDRKFEEICALADQSFFDMFTFEFIKGDPASALTERYSIVLTESVAEKLFGDEDPIGKFIRVRLQFNLKVTGVIRDVPRNSHMVFGCVIPFEILSQLRDDWNDWRPNNYHTYVLLQEGASPREVGQKIAGIVQKNDPGNNTELHLHPLTNVHLHALSGGGAITYVYIFSAMAVFILLIACINFMNLTTARSSGRAREVGVRKVNGADRGMLMRQFFGESVLMSFFALAVAIGLTEILLPVFNDISGKQLTFDLAGNLRLITGLIGIALITGLVSGSYPALFLSSFNPVRILKSSYGAESGGSVFRKVLVIIQFTLSIFLIIGTTVIYNQLEFIKNKNLGYDKEHILCIRMKTGLYQNLAVVAYEMEQNPNIKGITLSSCLLSSRESSTDRIKWEGKPFGDKTSMGIISVDYDFLDVYDIEMAEGRFFSREFPTDIREAYILNETAAKLVGLENPIGSRFSCFGDEGTVIGIVKDFHHESLRDEIKPLIMHMNPNWFDNMSVKIKADSLSATIDFLATTMNENAPDYNFEYRFLDDVIDGLYQSEQRMGVLFRYFTFLAIFISCLGLFGLASYMAEQRTREIGIRKVLGASVGSIIALLSKEFILLVCVASLLAWPLSWYIMHGWLQGFAYRSGMSIDIFFIAALMALFIALITISLQALRAALANPVNALRHE